MIYIQTMGEGLHNGGLKISGISITEFAPFGNFLSMDDTALNRQLIRKIRKTCFGVLDSKGLPGYYLLDNGGTLELYEVDGWEPNSVDEGW